MSDDFFKTRMGQRFYEATMPKIADQLERLNTNIEALVAELRHLRQAAPPPEPAKGDASPRGHVARAVAPRVSPPVQRDRCAEVRIDFVRSEPRLRSPLNRDDARTRGEVRASARATVARACSRVHADFLRL